MENTEDESYRIVTEDHYNSLLYGASQWAIDQVAEEIIKKERREYKTWIEIKNILNNYVNEAILGHDPKVLAGAQRLRARIMQLLDKTPREETPTSNVDTVINDFSKLQALCNELGKTKCQLAQELIKLKKEQQK
jgi:hypothetical protein